VPKYRTSLDHGNSRPSHVIIITVWIIVSYANAHAIIFFYINDHIVLVVVYDCILSTVNVQTNGLKPLDSCRQYGQVMHQNFLPMLNGSG